LSQETTNVEVLKEAYRRWNDTLGGSVDHFFSFVDDKISFGSVPRGAAPLEFATQYNSKNDLRGYFDALLADWKMVHYTIDEYIAQGDAVVARGSTSWTNKQTGKTAETP